MQRSFFESVSHDNINQANIFVASVGNSCFHWHYDYELLLVLEGEICVYCGNEPFRMETGNMFLFNSRTVHGVTETKRSNLCLIIQFSQDIFRHVLDKNQVIYFEFDSKVKNNFCRKPYAEFSELAAQIALLSIKKERRLYIRIQSLLLKFAADLLEYADYDIRRYPLNKEEEKNGEIIFKIQKIMEQKWLDKNISESICKELGMSEKTLYRYLKNTIGLSLKELIDISRIEKAKLELKNTDKPITFISDLCGFSNEVSFYRTFKKETGITPKSYREGKIERPASVEVKGYLLYEEGIEKKLLKQFVSKEWIDLLEE